MVTAGFYRPNMLVVEMQLDLYFVPRSYNKLDFCCFIAKLTCSKLLIGQICALKKQPLTLPPPWKKDDLP